MSIKLGAPMEKCWVLHDWEVWRNQGKNPKVEINLVGLNLQVFSGNREQHNRSIYKIIFKMGNIEIYLYKQILNSKSDSIRLDRLTAYFVEYLIMLSLNFLC